MNDPLQTAVRELYLAYPDRSLEVDRVDVDANGFLHLTATNPSGIRWFTLDDRGLIERRPDTDRDIPLAERLANGTRHEWEALAYRPGRRLVVRSFNGAGGATVLKGYRRRRSMRSALNHRVAEEAMSHGAFRVPRLTRHEPELETLVFEMVVGEPFHLDEAAVDACFRVGATLSRFQEVAGDGLPTFGPKDELEVLDAWKRKALLAAGGLPAGWTQARADLDAAIERLPRGEHGLCHRDLHDGQLMLVQEKPVLLDFDLLCRADVALDPANLLAHFSLRSLQKVRGADEVSVRDCGVAFLDGLDRQQNKAFWSRLRFYEATTFLRLALVYSLRPRWAHLTSDLVVLGRRCLEDQIRIG